MLQIIKNLDRADDPAVLIVYGHCPDPNRDFVPRFVMKETSSLGRLRSFHGSRQWTFFIAELASRLVAMQ
jgi:hypothetical protein